MKIEEKIIIVRTIFMITFLRNNTDFVFEINLLKILIDPNDMKAIIITLETINDIFKLNRFKS